MAARSALAALNKNVIMVLVANNEEAFIHSFIYVKIRVGKVSSTYQQTK